MIDDIDTIICSVFHIQPDILLAKRRQGRLIIARFTAIYIRYKRGATYEQLATHYQMTTSSVRHAIKKSSDFIIFDKHYLLKYELCCTLIDSQRQLYAPNLIRQGTRVWTRANSRGYVIEGVISNIDTSKGLFIVEQFFDPNYKTVHRISTGQIYEDFECCQDIEYIGM